MSFDGDAHVLRAHMCEAVGQPLLTVRFSPIEPVRDSQEWLSYKTILPTIREAHYLPGKSDCATLAVSKIPYVPVQERIVES